jgi:hypothetical protein
LTNVRKLAIQCGQIWHDEHLALDPEAWSLAAVKHSLTSLYLCVEGLEGPDLGAILCRTTALQRLELGNAPLLEDPRLHLCLVPLPPALRVLHFHCEALPPEVLPGLRAAAKQQGCALTSRFGSRCFAG